MKIFFSASLQGEVNTQIYHKIFSEIEAMGYEHVDSEVVKLSRDEFEELKNKGREEQIKRYSQKIDAIKKADICIFDVSAHSLSTGFLVNVALDLQKPTIALFYGDMSPYFLSGVENEKLIIQSYTEKNVKKVLRDLLDQAREKRDKRFNFFISPKLLEFLENTSNAEGVTKSKYIRNLIVEHMRQNKVADTEE